MTGCELRAPLALSTSVEAARAAPPALSPPAGDAGDGDVDEDEFFVEGPEVQVLSVARRFSIGCAANCCTQ